MTVLDGRENDKKVGDNPEKLDWRTTGAIPEVRTQGDCAQSIGAYTAAAGATANLYIHEGEKKDPHLFSVQRLLDCRVPKYACGQAFYDSDGYSLIINKPASPHDYYGEFSGMPGTCRNSEAGLKPKFSKWSAVYPAEDKEIEDALQHRTISVMVKMPTTIKLYKSGVISSDDCGKAGSQLYYQPLIVGYDKGTTQNREKMFGEKNDLPYWNTQWAFGKDWGEAGYMRIEKINGGTSQGACKINSYPYYIVPKGL